MYIWDSRLRMENHLYRIAKIVVNETEYSADSLSESKEDIVEISSNKYHLLVDNKSFEVDLDNIDFDDKNVTLTIEGKTYEVSLKNHLDDLVHDLGFDQVSVVEEKEILAPMPGLVLKVLVSPGQEISKGDDLIILEAMKMENVIQSPNDGVVKSIDVNQSQAVEKKQLLISFE